MKDWLDIPQDRPRPRPFRLALLMGLTTLLLLVAAPRLSWALAL